MARILLIDDSLEILAVLRTFLERRTHHETILATRGREGLKKAFQDRPDIAVVDVMMPDIDGYEVVRQLRSDPRTANIGIIILTARGQPVDEQAALRAGADMHLAKPVNMLAFAEAIDTVLAARSEPTPQETRVTIPILGLRGGTGVTTVAVNLAVLLQQIAPTALWDLSPTSGHTALFLGIQPKTHWGHLLGEPREPIDALLQRYKNGLQILCAPPVPSSFGWFNEEQAYQTLQALQARSTLTIVDMPPMLDPATQPILSVANRIVLLTGDDSPSIQTTLATLQALQRWQNKIIIVHNLSTSGTHLDTERLARVMRVRIQATLPYDADQRTALKRGTPLAQAKPSSPFVMALRSLTQQLLKP